MLIKLLRRSFASSVDYIGISHFTPELTALRDQIRKFSNEKINNVSRVFIEGKF